MERMGVRMMQSPDDWLRLTIEAISTSIAVADTCAMPILEEVQAVDLVFGGIAASEQTSSFVTDGLRVECEAFSTAISDVNAACRENECSSTRMKGALEPWKRERTVPVAGDVLGYTADNTRVWVGITVRKLKDDCEYQIPPRRSVERKGRTGKHSMYQPRHCSKCQDLPELGSRKAWRLMWCHNGCRLQRKRMGGKWRQARRQG